MLPPPHNMAFVSFYKQHWVLTLLYNIGILFLLFQIYSFFLVPTHEVTGGPGDAITGFVFVIVFLMANGFMVLCDLLLHYWCRTIKIRLSGIATTFVFWLIATLKFSLETHKEFGSYLYDSLGEVIGETIGWNDWVDFSLFCSYIAAYFVIAIILGHLLFKR